MSSEAQIRVSITILKTLGNLRLIDYQSRPTDFTMDVTGTKGPSPGAITVTTLGTDVSFAELVTPHLCFIKNMDPTNYVEVGIYDPSNNDFYPLLKIGPGHGWPIPLTHNFGESYEGTGTGTTAATKRLRIKANTASCVVSVEAFEE